MVSGNYQELLKRINDLLHVRFGERMKGTILFGSEAHGNSLPESDLDVMVLLNGPVNTGDDLEQIIQATYDIQLISDRSIHYIPADYDEYIKGEYALFRIVKEEGILYE
ncbi:MAG: nucleotidyltransferase domain-containing protein [Chitinispirillaceae bacterium]|nr:nucleotidyltransferase domain-containing protein [Chitinispirillaceae bacterium]